MKKLSELTDAQLLMLVLNLQSGYMNSGVNNITLLAKVEKINEELYNRLEQLGEIDFEL
jgi:hypothetical protein